MGGTKYLTAGFILEAGASIEDLKKITETMGAMAQKAGIKIVLCRYKGS